MDSLEKDCRGIAETVSDLLDEFLVVRDLAVPTVHIFTENALEELKRYCKHADLSVKVM